MKKHKNITFLLISLAFVAISVVIYQIYFKDVLNSNNLVLNFGIKQIDLAKINQNLWIFIQKSSLFFFILSELIIVKSLFYSPFSYMFAQNLDKSTEYIAQNHFDDKNTFKINIGQNLCGENVAISEYGLYQNILITGTIGTGKTSSAMYPITKQLIDFSAADFSEKMGMLILDVKGNYCKKVIKMLGKCGREDDLIIISLKDKYKYNPLDKPNLKPSVLANQLKEILLLFSPNNSESFWLDKCETILQEAIKLCRIYNDGYVTFLELHKLITSESYYNEKIQMLRESFISNKIDKDLYYDLLSSIDFFEKEFFALDERNKNILKSEITRITNPFVSDKDVINTFCSDRESINFNGFYDLVHSGKVLVLNMNINEYKSLSKIIAAYLKIDFQTEVLQRLSSEEPPYRRVAFISDEYSEYVTASDANFFSQSREARCINVVATQSYTSILNTIKDKYTTEVIIQSLVNKLWFRSDDIYTIESAQKLIGRSNQEIVSKTISESAKETSYNYLTNSLRSKNSNLSESYNTSVHKDFVYEINSFSQDLETFTAISFLSNGYKILPPSKIYLKPYFRK